MHLLIYVDGGSRGNPGPAAIGAVIHGGTLKYSISRSIGIATNNVAEYEALKTALEYATEIDAESVEVYSDSQLMVRQVQGIYEVRKPELRNLWIDVQGLIALLPIFSIAHIPREQNTEADALVNQALDRSERAIKSTA